MTTPGEKTEGGPGVSPAELMRAVARRLADAGVDAPGPEAGWLVRAAYGLRGGQLHSIDELPVDATPGEGPGALLESMIVRRITREPLQHILGSAPFRRITVPVGRGVFVPRPETELLVDAVLPVLRSVGSPLATDLCSGSGALALALVDELPRCRVVALERLGPSGDWLLANTAESTVEARLGDVLDDGVLADLAGTVDAVVCNPPYVPTAAEVAPEVRFDPDVAVFAGPDGLALIPAVIDRAARLLRAGGVLALEHDDSQGDVVAALLERTGDWQTVRPHRDLAARPRYVLATRR